MKYKDGPGENVEVRQQPLDGSDPSSRQGVWPITAPAHGQMTLRPPARTRRPSDVGQAGDSHALQLLATTNKSRTTLIYSASRFRHNRPRARPKSCPTIGSEYDMTIPTAY